MVFRISNEVAFAQGYRLLITQEQVVATAGDTAGLFYASVTLVQMARLAHGELPACNIEDAPDMLVRGVMLDISRDKVPTIETLLWLIDKLAALKINQLQLYTEHTFAYRNHPEVWQHATPITSDDIALLDRYCRAANIELVPNQNSFGHMERWLRLPRYQHLAELPQGGAPLPWGGRRPYPTTLCPTDPRSLELLADLYDDLLPNFTSTLFNVGCDETFDLRGEGRSAIQVREQGEGRVYLEFLKRINKLVRERGRTMAFWGDIILRHPELVPELPSDTLALEWGYESDHPFDEHGGLFAQSGIPFYVCPGTSSWSSLAGRTTNMRANIASAVRNGIKHGAVGCMVTDWGDHGHWQPLAVSLPAFLYGASLAWGYERNVDMELAKIADLHLCDGFAAPLLKLGDCYLYSGATHANSTEFFRILFSSRLRPFGQHVTAATLRAVAERIEDIVKTLPAENKSIIAKETCQVVRMLRASLHRGLALLEGEIEMEHKRRELRRETESLMASHAATWRLRNREGGLRDSLAVMEAILREY